MKVWSSNIFGKAAELRQELLDRIVGATGGADIDGKNNGTKASGASANGAASQSGESGSESSSEGSDANSQNVPIKNIANSDELLAILAFFDNSTSRLVRSYQDVAILWSSREAEVRVPVREREGAWCQAISQLVSEIVNGLRLENFSLRKDDDFDGMQNQLIQTRIGRFRIGSTMADPSDSS
ncbi:hypothetical protein Taro_052377 [Colocasia esculenta]|uniref:Uncharacterized protein n=1 Tax=Colocasia esculenta TaxID=4460 RepID=A0A843XJG9_COLES|nr:hypothetical protein [Colocasia esculenta]